MLFSSLLSPSTWISTCCPINNLTACSLNRIWQAFLSSAERQRTDGREGHWPQQREALPSNFQNFGVWTVGLSRRVCSRWTSIARTCPNSPEPVTRRVYWSRASARHDYNLYWLAAAKLGRLVLGLFSTPVFQCGHSNCRAQFSSVNMLWTSFNIRNRGSRWASNKSPSPVKLSHTTSA